MTSYVEKCQNYNYTFAFLGKYLWLKFMSWFSLQVVSLVPYPQVGDKASMS